MKLKGKKIGILIESDFYEHEIWYYHYRFPEEGAELHFLTRLWGQPSITFKGHEYHAPFECNESFEGMDDSTLRSFAAIIVPSAMVSDPNSHLLPHSSSELLLKRAFSKVLSVTVCGSWHRLLN
jgi:protease I